VKALSDAASSQSDADDLQKLYTTAMARSSQAISRAEEECSIAVADAKAQVAALQILLDNKGNTSSQVAPLCSVDQIDQHTMALQQLQQEASTRIQALQSQEAATSRLLDEAADSVSTFHDLEGLLDHLGLCAQERSVENFEWLADRRSSLSQLCAAVSEQSQLRVDQEAQIQTLNVTLQEVRFAHDVLKQEAHTFTEMSKAAAAAGNVDAEALESLRIALADNAALKLKVRGLKKQCARKSAFFAMVSKVKDEKLVDLENSLGQVLSHQTSAGHVGSS
jgi:hypothetical protein